MISDQLINAFLNEDMLITKPSVFIYIPKHTSDDVEKNGIYLPDGKVSAYLTRLPENNGAYAEFLDKYYPVQITYSRLKRIKDQSIKIIPVNIDIDPKKEIDDDVIKNLKRKYDSYLNICYNDHIPLKDIPHIDIEFSSKIIPAFVCKIMKINGSTIG